MKIENVEISGFKTAFRGMRNPLNSWNRSDSYFGILSEYDEYDFDIAEHYVEKKLGRPMDYDNIEDNRLLDEFAEFLDRQGVIVWNGNAPAAEVAFIGPNDLDLAQRLIKSGPEHCKFLRQIYTGCDITAPLYW